MITVQLQADGPITTMDEAELRRVDGVVDNPNEYTTYTEYWLAERCVHRSVHVTLKQGIGMGLVQGELGG